MAQETTVADTSCLIPTFERNRYFTGKPMMVSDFDAEQRYLIGKSRLQNQLIHGPGIICGLALGDARLADGKLTVEIAEGAALDCCGNLIVVNRTDRVEVQRPADLDGVYYVYIRFSECVRQPIMATTNASQCGEVCCYNRIRETFELIGLPKTSVTPTTFTGAVKTGARGDVPVVGARVKALQSGLVKAATLSDGSGNFSLDVGSAGSFDIEVSATGFATAGPQPQSINAGQSKPLGTFKIVTQAGPLPAEVCEDLTQDYFEENSRGCSHCDDPKVFLGIANISGTHPVLDTTSDEVRQHRAVVYTNPMLHDLFCDHVSDFNNPHRTTAAQVKALQNVNGVGNLDSKADVVARIDLISDGTLTITPDVVGNKISISGPAAATRAPKNVAAAANVGIANSFAREDHVHTLDDKVVERRHLSDDTVDKLVFSSDASIKVVTKQGTNIGDRQIDITTKVPGPSSQMPKAVSLDPVIGTSTNYAREDHVHNLSSRVVTKDNFADEIINTFVAADDGSITVTRDLTVRQVRLKTNPATDVSSVGREKRVGTSLSFARQDHIHNLQINDRGPDDKGTFLLTAGDNVTIKGGAQNELIVSTRSSQGLTVTAGTAIFEQVSPGETRVSPPIHHQLPVPGDPFAIVLGIVGSDNIIFLSDFADMDSAKPFLQARFLPGTDNFRIDLRDRRPKEGGAANLPPTTYVVRYWAIPFTKEGESVVSPPPG